MRPACVVLLALGGCDVVFGLDRPVVPDAPIDAPPGPDLARASLQRVYIEAANQPGVVGEDADAVVTVVLDNGARPDVVPLGAGEYEFAWTRGMRYAVTVERPGRSPLTIVSDAEHVRHAARELAPETAPLPRPETVLDVSIANTAGVTLTLVTTTGVWTQASSESQASPAQIEADWTQPGVFLTGEPHLLPAGSSLYCAGLPVVTHSNGLTYRALRRIGVTQVTMLDGERTEQACTLGNDLTLDRCARAVVDRGAELVRVGSAAPSTTYPQVSFATAVVAVPSMEIGPVGGLTLAIQAGNATLTPFTGDVPYTNPYPDHADAVVNVMTRQRTVYAPGASLPGYLSPGTYHYYTPTPNCGPVSTADEIAIPSPPAIGGRVIGDETIQLLPDRPVELTWTLRSPGPVDYYTVRLLRPTRTAASGTELVPLHTWLTTEQELVVERARLPDGVPLVLEVGAFMGVPDADLGDYRTSAWPAPLTAGVMYSGVFLVVP